jgi:hypothetical protein
MLPIYIMWVIVFALTLVLAFKLFKRKTSTINKALSESILFVGSFAFLTGILAQVTGLMEAMEVIQTYGDISPALIAGGIKVSLLAPVYGFVIFIISFSVWFTTRRIISK